VQVVVLSSSSSTCRWTCRDDGDGVGGASGVVVVVNTSLDVSR